jgi:FkbM family methyltransferase
MSLLKIANFILNHPLSRGRRLANLARFVRWQIGARLVPGPVAVDFVSGSRLLARPGMTGATGNVYVGLHEFPDMAFVLHFLRPEDLFVDVGANIGSYTILAAAGIGARVVAFEPDGVAFDWLTKSVGLNGVGHHVEAHRLAVGERLGAILMTVGGDSVNHVLPPQNPLSDSSSQEVSVTTLDACLGQRAPMVIKIDVEGFETAVVAGGGATFANHGLHAVLMELTGHGDRYGYDEDAIRSRMMDWGFHRCLYDPFTRRLEESPEDATTSGNTLFVRDFDFARDRLRSAPAFRVHGQDI